MQLFLPEGYAPQERGSWEHAVLQEAATSGDVLQAPVLCRDITQGLTVDLFPYEGFISRAEISLAAREGRTEPSAVGPVVMFCVIGRLPDGRWLLSRAEAQRKAQTLLLGQLNVGDVLPAVATAVLPHKVICDVGCGISAVLGAENISVSRARNAAERLRCGQKLFVAAAVIDRQFCEITLTHKELLGTWRENAARFLPGQTVRGIVRGIKSYGVFVELAPNLCGLAEPFDGLSVGMPVSVFIKSVLPEKKKVKLTVLAPLPCIGEVTQMRYYITEGNVAGWAYFTF